jgi:branched-chain amino acid transport system substrate-binding protein
MFSNPAAPLLSRRQTLALLPGLLCSAATLAKVASPVLVGIDAEFSLDNSTSAQAIELGARIAMAEINQSGGVLGGRQLDIITRDHRAITARGIKNIREFVAMPDVVAVLGGRFSPVIIEQIPVLNEARLPFIAVWSAADAIVDKRSQPNFVFRLSLRDSLAMPFMLQTARRRGLDKVGLLVTNTAWGRSNLTAVERHMRSQRPPAVVDVAWYNWQDTSLVERYLRLLNAGAKAIVLVANDAEGALLVREVAQLPAEQRMPVISHWGVTGGHFFKGAGAAQCRAPGAGEPAAPPGPGAPLRAGLHRQPP